MKRILIVFFSLIVFQSFSQVVTEETKRRFTFGLDIFTDMWQDLPNTLEPQTINPGVNIFGSYNYMFGESNLSFSPGLGLSVHNLYSDSWLRNTSDSLYFEFVPDTIDFKRSKLTMTYMDIPIEIRFKTESEFRVAVGFKFGFLIKAQTKFKGDDYIESTKDEVIIKKGKFDFVETTRYGFTGRIGYKWLNLWGYYQLSTVFTESKGPAMYPISIGITIIPF